MSRVLHSEDLLARAGFSVEKLQNAVAQARQFHTEFLQAAKATSGGGLQGFRPGKTDQKAIRQAGGIAPAVVNKLGSNSLAKRRPDDVSPFVAHVQQKLDAGEPLQFRLGAGPVKNVHHFGAQQTPDLAEYLMLVQLARAAAAVATLYPHGVKVQMVPDDKRGAEANQWPEEYGRRYVSGVRQLSQEMGFGSWLTVEDGQARLYEQYKVASFRAAAAEQLRDWSRQEPDAYAAKMAKATQKALDNMVPNGVTEAARRAEAEASALRYLIALRAEALSGIFGTRDAFPARYANHPGSFQLYTMGAGITKLPWQIALPHQLLSGDGPGKNNLPELPLPPVMPTVPHRSSALPIHDFEQFAPRTS